MKKGFTLIEILIVMSLCSLVFCSSIFSIKRIKKLDSNTELGYYGNAVGIFINNCQCYCKSNEVSGQIYFKEGGKEVKFMCDSNLISILTFPKNINIKSCNAKKHILEISDKGFVKTACTIDIINLHSRKVKEITICVGSGYVEVKNDEK